MKLYKKLLAENDTKLELLIVNSEKNTNHSPTLVDQNQSILWRFYKKYYVSKKTKALKTYDLSNLLNEIPLINCKTLTTKNGYKSFLEGDIEKIKNHQLDFILQFGFGKINGKILQSAKHGIWSFQHGFSGIKTGKAPCFWEIFNEELVTGAAIKRLTDSPDEEINFEGWFFKNGAFFTLKILIKSISKVLAGHFNFVLILGTTNLTI